MSNNDEELLRLTGAGDKGAFCHFYENTNRSLYSFILSILRNPQDAEEVLQETYLKVWTMAAHYQPQGKPLAWMFTIARNLCYMRLRDQKRMADIGLDELEGNEPGEVCVPLEMVTDSIVLRAALEILNEEERQIVLLYTAAGLKHREIAEALLIPLATELSKYRRAVKKLKGYLVEG